MVQKEIIKKMSFFVIAGILLSVGFIPTTMSDGTKSISDVDGTITIESAQKVANVKLQELNKNAFKILSSAEICSGKGEPLFYIFDLQPQGYLVVSTSYDLPPVIAYSFTSDFLKHDRDNPLFDMIYADLTLRLKYRDLIPMNIINDRHLLWETYLKGIPQAAQGFEQWPPEGTTPTGGWLLTNWHQNAPYNNYCPLDLVNGGRSLAGCPAVTMAQILNYHNTTCDVQFTDSDDYHHTYAGNNYWIDNDYVLYGFPSFPTLNTYLTTLQSHYDFQIPLTNDDKAAITFACGVAESQVYNAGGSGTFGVNQAYDGYQRFNCMTAELLDDSDLNVYERVASNMKIALPAHLAVVNEGWTSGHNLVIDGYNTNNYFHLNFGWGGSYNGWYIIPDELPYSLTVLEGVIVDITGIPDLYSDSELAWTNVVPTQTVTSSIIIGNFGDAGSTLDWQVTEWPSWGTWTFTPSIGYDLQPEDGLFAINVAVEAPNQQDQLYTGEIKVVNIRNTSDYELIPVSLQTGSNTHENLFCNGSLIWTDIKPGATITGSFTVENVGSAASNLSWDIIGYPAWGTWTFSSIQGDHLTPEDGPVTINVSVIAPRKWNKEFSGQIIIINTENSTDNDTIPVSLATPYTFELPCGGILKVILERFPHAFPLLRLLLNI
jgi:hypothetical protein